ncbi:MAG: hypothetical protein V1905_00830 [bacterium]
MAEEKQQDQVSKDQVDGVTQKNDEEAKKKELDKEKKIIAILNHIKTKSPLPEGVTVLETREMTKEVEAMVNMLKDEIKKKNGDTSLLSWEAKNEIGNLIPAPNVFLQSTNGEGVISLPSKLIYFNEDGVKQAVGTEYQWFVFKSLYLAEKILQMLYGEKK